jgi:hypothetical protein
VNPKDIANPEVPVRLVLNADAAEVTMTRLGPDAPKSIRHAGPVRDVSLSIPDEMILVDITLAVATHPKALAAPTDIRAEAV